MTPDDKTARDRYAILTGVRFGGIVLMGLGLWMFFGGSLGGNYGFGGVLFAVGLIEAFVVPKLLARKWRSPR
jgi:hypothetical protein